MAGLDGLRDRATVAELCASGQKAGADGTNSTHCRPGTDRRSGQKAQADGRNTGHGRPAWPSDTD